MTTDIWLLIQAKIWRFLMEIGMILHRLASPRPRAPAFAREVPSTLSPHGGSFKIQFFVPRDYEFHRRIQSKRFPLILNLHGGGFTIGAATDDARWADMLCEKVDAMVASVDYRLAPEYPFPTAVQDSTDALLYLIAHSEELLIDVNRIALSGFSAGANLALTVPILYHETQQPAEGNSTVAECAKGKKCSNQEFVTELSTPISASIVWYPPTDYTLTREQRKATMPKAAHGLPSFLHNLFDRSYMQPPSLDKTNPLLSPAAASDLVLASLPDNIIMYTCELDMLESEARAFKGRLEKLGKRVSYRMVPQVPHGWDKSPHPFRPQPGVYDFYAEACSQLQDVFDTCSRH